MLLIVFSTTERVLKSNTYSFGRLSIRHFPKIQRSLFGNIGNLPLPENKSAENDGIPAHVRTQRSSLFRVNSVVDLGHRDKRTTYTAVVEGHIPVYPG